MARICTCDLCRGCISCGGKRQATHRTPDGYAVCVPCLLQIASEELAFDPDEHPEDWGIKIIAPALERRDECL